MIREPIIMAVCSDIAGQVRGKGFPARELPMRLQRGVGWTPTNVQITCFGVIADSPYGALGDLLLVPDRDTEVRVDFEDDSPPEHFIIGDILTLDGEPWECCTRGLLRAALDDLREQAGVTLTAAFEHEFFYTGAGRESPSLPNGYRLGAQRDANRFCEVFTAALDRAGLQPDTIMAEYGPGQYEATVAPAAGLAAADQCIVLRELARASAARLGQRVSFSPLVTREIVGNGVHVHLSLNDAASGAPVSYDSRRPYGVSETMARFVAGILRHAPALVAFTAPSVPSYQRLVPHRWSAAFNNLGYRDREACVRICPFSERGGRDPAPQFNVEYRAADAAASPYLQLAVLARAGLQGIREELPLPAVTEQDLSVLDAGALAGLGVSPLPAGLAAALERLTADKVVSGWFPANFLDVYRRHKRAEIDAVAGLDDDALCARYAQVY